MSPPVRAVSQKTAPSTDHEPFPDLMIRLTSVRIAPPRTSARESSMLIPDGLTHPKFRPRRSGKGHHFLCCKHAVDELLARGPSFPALSRHSPRLN